MADGQINGNVESLTGRLSARRGRSAPAVAAVASARSPTGAGRATRRGGRGGGARRRGGPGGERLVVAPPTAKVRPRLLGRALDRKADVGQPSDAGEVVVVAELQR